MADVYVEVIEECLICGYKRSYLMKHLQADSKSDITKAEDRT